MSGLPDMYTQSLRAAGPVSLSAFFTGQVFYTIHSTGEEVATTVNVVLLFITINDSCI